MKTAQLSQIGVLGLLALSLLACQKGNDSTPSSNPGAPAPIATQKEAPMTNQQLKEKAESDLLSVGLKFEEPPVLEDAEIHLMTAKWDARHYRNFLRETDVKPKAEKQIEVLKNYISTIEMYVEAELNVDFESLENESAEDLARLRERALLLAQVGLAQARVLKLEKRLQSQQSQQQEQQKQEQQVQEQEPPSVKE